VYTLTGAEHSYRVLLEGMNEGAVTITPDGTVTYCNNRFTDIVKVPSTQVINSSIYGFFSPNDKIVLEEMLRKKGKMEINVQLKDGTAVPVYLSCTSVELNGDPSLCMVVTDLTEQKRNEEKKIIESIHRRIFDDMKEGALIFGFSDYTVLKNGLIIYSNNSFASLAKTPLPKIVGSSIFDFIAEEDIQVVKKMLEEIKQHRVQEREIYLKRGDEELVSVNFSIGSMLKRAVTYAIVTDLTEIKRREQEAKRLGSELLTAQEKERKRIAGELHDGLASSLSALKMTLQNKVDSIMKNMPSEVRIEDVITTLQTNIEELRRVMTSLHPSMLDDLGITSTISWFCREYQKTYPHIMVKLEVDVSEGEISALVKTSIYRICQEALNNIAKHSKATLVILSLQRIGKKIELAIKDNGQGFDSHKKIKAKDGVKGLGLDSMRERTEILGGSFSIVSSVGSGTKIHASWPL
jgi:PAS domain S-box-containing protein